MKPFLFIILIFFLALYSCQPNCEDFIVGTHEALIFNFNIVNASGEQLVGNGRAISLEVFQVRGIDLNGEEGQVYPIQDTLKGTTFLSALIYNGVINQTPFKTLVFDYGNTLPSDTLTFDYHYTEEDCGNYLGDYTITLRDEILCHRCYRQVIDIQK